MNTAIALLICFVSLIWRGGQKAPFTSFSPVTSTNVGQNFLTFSFNHFFHTGVKLQGHTLFQFQIIELEPRASLKKCFFPVKSL